VNTPLSRLILHHLTMSGHPWADAALWNSFEAKEWKSVLAWLDASGLALYFRERLRATNTCDNLPPKVRAELDIRAAHNRIRVAAMAEEFQTITRAIEDSGVKYAVLKGFALVPGYCPDLTSRTQYDLDYLIDPASHHTVGQVLGQVGFHRKLSRSQDPIVYGQALPAGQTAAGPIGLYSVRLSRSIEVHGRLWDCDEERIRINFPDDLLNRATRHRYKDFKFAALCDEDALIFQILHAFRHLLRNWCRLSVLYEIAHFLKRRSHDRVFWEQFDRRISNLRWAPEASQVIFSLATSLFGAPVPCSMRARTAIYPALTGWVEKYGKFSALQNFSGDKYSLLLHQEFLDSPADWRAIRARRLFPLRAPPRLPEALRPPGASSLGRLWRESRNVLRRLYFHTGSNFRFTLEYPRWRLKRRALMAGSLESAADWKAGGLQQKA
jgi:hypothetical protein